MYTTTSRNERTVIGALAITLSALGLSVLVNAFLPADPHVLAARQHAILAKVEKVREAAALRATPLTTASERPTIH